MNISKMKVQDLDYTRYYKKWHRDTAEHIKGMKNFYQKMLCQFLPSNKKIRILDVGCGMGFAMMSLQDQEYDSVEGIDIDSGQVKSCLDKKLKVTQVENSTEYLRKMPNTYDLILVLDVIEHNPYEAQLEFVRGIEIALKPGGKLICTVPNANSVLASRWRYNDWTHHISFTEHSLDFLLFNGGFEEIQIFETDFFERPHFRSLLSRSIFKKSLWKPILHWWIFRTFRASRRLEMIAELGWDQGRNVPLSLNLLATAVKSL